MKALIFTLILALPFGVFAESKSTEEAKEAICTKLCDWDFMKEVTPEEVQKLIDEGHIVNGGGDLGETPLLFASNPEVIRVLVKNGADINAKDDHDGYTVLHVLFDDLMGGDPSFKIIKAFLENGADPNIKNKEGETPTYLFAGSRHFKTYEEDNDGNITSIKMTDEGYKLLGLLVFYGADLTVTVNSPNWSAYDRLTMSVYRFHP